MVPGRTTLAQQFPAGTTDEGIRKVALTGDKDEVFHRELCLQNPFLYIQYLYFLGYYFIQSYLPVGPSGAQYLYISNSLNAIVLKPKYLV